MKNLTYGFIGCGMMGQEHLRNIAMLKGIDVSVIFDPDESMRSISNTLVPNAKFVDSEEEVICNKDLDALIISSPNYLHFSQLAKILSIRPIPVLIEKPVCTSLEQIRELQLIGKNYPSPIWVAMEYRYMPPISMFVEEINSNNKIGEIISLSIREHRYPFLQKIENWNRFNKNTGGTLVEKCCHFFDLMRFILKSEPTRIYASGAQDLNHLNEEYNGLVPDIVDNAFVIVDFASKKRAMLDLNMFADGSWYQESLCAIGHKAKIECKIPGPTRFWPKKSLGDSPLPKLILSPRDPKGPIIMDVPVDSRLLKAGDHNGSTFYQHEKFAQVLRGVQHDVEVDMDDGIKAVIMGLAAERSIRTGKAIDLTSGEYCIT